MYCLRRLEPRKINVDMLDFKSLFASKRFMRRPHLVILHALVSREGLIVHYVVPCRVAAMQLLAIRSGFQ